MNSAIQLNQLGQSVWYDNIRRSLIEDGTLMDRIERREIYGVTSNPSIFRKAIAESSDYDQDLKTMAWAGVEAEAIFYKLAIQDIRNVADLFLPYYDSTHGQDGFVSLEVNPTLAHDTAGTIEEARWLWSHVNRPNLMVKIPATKAGLPAITQAIADGINVNVTLIFSRKRYRQVMEAYVSGLEQRLGDGEALDDVASVASFFVSRLDSKADAALQAIIDAGGDQGQVAARLYGQLAVANTRLAYRDYEQFFNSDRFEKLAAQGAQRQRPLWASTSAKNPAFSDVKYVEMLVAPNTVNTMPPDTLDAFLDHGVAEMAIYQDLDTAESNFRDLADLGIDLDVITQELEDEGVEQFSQAFEELLSAIEARRSALTRGLGDLFPAIQARLTDLENNDVVSRMYRHDPTLWTDDPSGQSTIQKRLGWLNLPTASQALIVPLATFMDEVLDESYEKVLLLGMGGSSLAPETMALVLGPYMEGLALKVLDSTVPAQIRAAEDWVDYETTLFVVSSKSGTTTETLDLQAYFWQQAQERLGPAAGEHFVAITDPGSPLAKLGEEKQFRAVFTADPNVGGRYSVLTHFGLVPATLSGVDVLQLLWNAEDMASKCSPMTSLDQNPGAVLGVILGVAAREGRNKLTFYADDQIAPLGAWLEQLIAESSGKSGQGIVPIVDEPLVDAQRYAQDRLFVYLRATGERDHHLNELMDAGHPVLTIDIAQPYDLGGEFFRWEIATAIACSILGVNAFDQPDVQDNKDRTRQKIRTYAETGSLTEPETIWSQGGIDIYGESTSDIANAGDIGAVIAAFTAQAKEGDYIAINAYLPREADVEEKLQNLRERILADTGKATTLGFGPRFLHSTGQLHKGGENNGLFLQITQTHDNDLPVPGKDYTFSVLARAQAQGDQEALLSRGRRVLRVNIPPGDSLLF